MINGKTSTGFEFSVREDAGEDWRLVDAISDTQSGNKLKMLLGLKTICEVLLGADGYARLQKHVAHDDGFVSIHDMERETTEIFDAINVNSKN